VFEEKAGPGPEGVIVTGGEKVRSLVRSSWSFFSQLQEEGSLDSERDMKKGLSLVLEPIFS